MPDDSKLIFENTPDENETEGEEDLRKLELKELDKTVVAATDWTTETIIGQLDKGNIDINPDFQRRDAWTQRRKSRFIESLIVGLPIPQLVLAENKKRKGGFIVIDGKQRLLSLRQFAAKSDDKDYEQLRLTGLDAREDLNGKTLEDLETDPVFAGDFATFQNQTIRTVVIRSWPNEDVLYLIFLRLNTSSVPLAPQELRQALHPGPFLSYVNQRSGELAGFQKLLKLTKPDFRMRDAELLVRFFAFQNFIREYKGNLKAFLDSTCEKFNANWSAREQELKGQVSDLESAMDATFSIFGEKNAFRKWDGDDYERRFNRAVFDIMCFYFTDSTIGKKAVKQSKQVEGEFKRLCAQDALFRRSLETTTKSLEATAARLNIWGSVLARKLNLKLAVPKLTGKTISFK